MAAGVFTPPKSESWRSRRFKWLMNLHPGYRGTGGVVTYIASDWQEVHMRLPLNLFTIIMWGRFSGAVYTGQLTPFIC